MEQLAWSFGLASLAGLVKYLQLFTGKKDERPAWEWSVAFISALTGGFVGVLTLLAVEGKLEINYVHLAIAVAGYGGPVTLDFFLQLGRDIATRFAGRAPPGGKDDAPKA